EVAAVRHDRVVGQQRVADPGDQGAGGGRGVVAGGLQGAGQEGFDPGGGRGVAVEEVAPLGHQGSAGGGGRQGRQAGAIIFTVIFNIDVLGQGGSIAISSQDER